MKNPFLKKLVLFLSYLLIVSILIKFYMYQTSHAVSFDALQYLKIGSNFSFANDWKSNPDAHMRLYGYPLFISLFFRLFAPSMVSITIFIFQTILYFTSVLLLSYSTAKIFPKAKPFVYVALLSNFLLYPYLVISLTDALSVILWIFVAIIVVEIFLSVLFKSPKVLWLFLFLGFTIGYSIMVRPANIQLIILIPVILFLWLYHRRHYSDVKTKLFLLTIASVMGFMIAVLPQIYINHKLFGIISFLPVMNLGDAQVQWGIKNLKYATNCSGIGLPGMFYCNPFVNKGDIANISWYYLHPLDGITTIFLHIFSALDFDYLFPYVYELNPKYQILTFLFSQTIVFYGIYGYFKSIELLRDENDANSKVFFSLLVILLPIIAIGWGGIIGLSVPENRFSLPMITLLLPFAFFAVHSSYRDKRVIFIFAFYLILAYMLSSFIAMQKVI